MSAKEETQESTLKRRVRKVCRTRPHLFIIFFVSILGFCYHFHLALKQYLEFKTTVSFAFEENYRFRYPALTLCFPDVIPHFLMAQRFPEYEEAVQLIHNESRRREDKNFWTKEESGKVNQFKMKGKYLHKYFEEKVFPNLTVLDILDHWSHGLHDDCVVDAQPLVKDGYKIYQCESIAPPIETINGDYRCFTYLSQLDTTVNDSSLFMTSLFIKPNQYEQRTNKVVYVSHALNTSQPAHPFETDFRGRAMIHSPSTIPVPQFYPSIPLYQWSRFYDIEFSKTVSYLLEKPYETNCNHYRTGLNETNQSFGDCVSTCLSQKYREKCKCLPRSGILYRRSQLRTDDHFCGKVNKCQFLNLREECAKNCQKDCLEEEYEFQKFADIPFYAHNNLTGLQISRKAQLDKVYRHSPAVTFIQLICDFGGLGGLWLGFSVITITTAIIQLISKPLERIVEGD